MKKTIMICLFFASILLIAPTLSATTTQSKVEKIQQLIKTPPGTTLKLWLAILGVFVYYAVVILYFLSK